MKNPITGEELKLVKGTVTVKYKGENITVPSEYYFDEVTGEEFQTEEQISKQDKEVKRLTLSK